MSYSGRFISVTFDQAILREVFPQLTEEACSDIALATLFDVLCWQIRLQLLSHRSIYRIETPAYDEHENCYQILARSDGIFSTVARVSFRYVNVNRAGYGDLALSERNQLSDRGVFPPQAMMTISSALIEGDETYVNLIYERFYSFLREEVRQVDLLWLLKESARQRLTKQSHAWLALQPSVVEFYSITAHL